MFFGKRDIDTGEGTTYVRLDTLLERVNEAIEEKLAYEPSYSLDKRVCLEDAEKFLFELYGALKNF